MRKFTVFFVALLLLGCTSRTIYKKPEDLISKDLMVALWTDIYIANSAKAVKNDQLDIKANYMPFIYEKYKIDSSRFMRSSIYYTSKVELYENMFQEVESNLRVLRDQYDPDLAGIDPNLPVWKRDSIRRAREESKGEDARKAREKLREKNDTLNVN